MNKYPKRNKMLHPSSYLKLPANFYEISKTQQVTNPRFVEFNAKLAQSLKLAECLQNDIHLYAGNSHLPHTLALAYAGHQFGYYVPLLGDGRAHLLGEIHVGNMQWDVQLKGSGRTKFSRNGDGRAPLSSVLREYLLSEAMNGLGIPTTRSLAAVVCDGKLQRQEGVVAQGILTRVASCHLRVGTFQYALNAGGLKELADYTINRLYPSLFTEKEIYPAFFRKVVEKQAYLIARWQSVGFIHGVMNTDNMTISGETLDYGPCAFLDEFDTQCVFSSIDYYGRYAFGNQPGVAYWNLAQLGQSLLPLLRPNNLAQSQEIMQEILDSFFSYYQNFWYQQMHLKLGLKEENKPLIGELFTLMQRSRPDYTTTFLLLSKALEESVAKEELIQNIGSRSWVEQWMSCLDKAYAKTTMEHANPIYIARNHLIEKAINNYLSFEDKTLFDLLLEVFQNPYQEKPNTQHLQIGPTEQERVRHTFCGT